MTGDKQRTTHSAMSEPTSGTIRTRCKKAWERSKPKPLQSLIASRPRREGKEKERASWETERLFIYMRAALIKMSILGAELDFVVAVYKRMKGQAVSIRVRRGRAP